MERFQFLEMFWKEYVNPYLFSSTDKTVQMEVKYQDVHGGCCAAISSRPKKAIMFSGIFGLKAFSVGADVAFEAFDAEDAKFSKYECSAGFDNGKYSASVAIASKCDLLRGTLAHKLWPGTSVGGEVSYSISTGKKTLWLGASHQCNDALLVKAKISTDCEAAAALQYKWKEGSSVSLSGNMKYDDQKKAFEPRFGVSFSIKPW